MDFGVPHFRAKKTYVSAVKCDEMLMWTLQVKLCRSGGISAGRPGNYILDLHFKKPIKDCVDMMRQDEVQVEDEIWWVFSYGSSFFLSAQRVFLKQDVSTEVLGSCTLFVPERAVPCFESCVSWVSCPRIQTTQQRCTWWMWVSFGIQHYCHKADTSYPLVISHSHGTWPQSK